MKVRYRFGVGKVSHEDVLKKCDALGCDLVVIRLSVDEVLVVTGKDRTREDEGTTQSNPVVSKAPSVIS